MTEYPEHMDVIMAARYLGCSVQTVRNYIHKRGLPAHKLSPQKIILRKSEIDEWIDGKEAIA